MNGFPGEIPWANRTSGVRGNDDGVNVGSDCPRRGQRQRQAGAWPGEAQPQPLSGRCRQTADTQAVPGFPSNAAAVELVGEGLPRLVIASAAELELDTLTCPGRLSSSHCARTRSSASMPSQAGVVGGRIRVRRGSSAVRIAELWSSTPPKSISRSVGVGDDPRGGRQRLPRVFGVETLKMRRHPERPARKRRSPAAPAVR